VTPCKPTSITGLRRSPCCGPRALLWKGLPGIWKQESTQRRRAERAEVPDVKSSQVMCHRRQLDVGEADRAGKNDLPVTASITRSALTSSDSPDQRDGAVPG
jgi:hypothetical protein